MTSRSARLSLLFLFVALAASRLCARTQARPSSAAAEAHPKARRMGHPDLSLDDGVVSNGVYRNAALGFACKIPAGWVLRTDEMNARDEAPSASTGESPSVRPDGSGDDPAKSTEPQRTQSSMKGSEASSATKDSGGRVLLAAFSRPPEAMAEDVNSSILIAAESVAGYPGLKDAAQYFGPLTEVAKARGFKVVNEPYAFPAGTKMVVRGDFQKDVGSRVMRQSTLVILARGYAVSFTFIGGTEEETEELLQGLSFAAGTKTAR